MKRWIAAAVVAAGVMLPLAAAAQPAGPPQGGPPPAVRAKMDKLLADTRLAAMNDLRPDHRTAVGGLVDQVSARSLDPRAAAQQIDALLTPDEKTRLVARETKFRADMRAVFAGGPPPPPGGPPPGAGPPPAGPPPGGGPPGGGFRQRAPDPGRFLLTLSRQRRFRGPEPRASGAP